MAGGNFDSEIKQAMTPSGGGSATRQSAKSSGGKTASQPQPKSGKMPPATSMPMQDVQHSTMPHMMQGMHGDAAAHAAGIAHAILRHSGGNY